MEFRSAAGWAAGHGVCRCRHCFTGKFLLLIALNVVCLVSVYLTRRRTVAAVCLSDYYNMRRRRLRCLVPVDGAVYVDSCSRVSPGGSSSCRSLVSVHGDHLNISQSGNSETVAKIWKSWEDTV